MNAREKILLVMEPDGFVSVYGPKHVDVTVVETWSPDHYEVGESDEQVAARHPYIFEKLCRDDLLRATAMPKNRHQKQETGLWDCLELMEANSQQLAKRTKQEAIAAPSVVAPSTTIFVST